MAFGITNTGFNKKTLAESLDSLKQRTIDAFGAVNTSEDSVFGQFNGIIAEILGDLWDLAEDVYSSQYATSALGASLDAVSELVGVSRLAATSSSVVAIVEGTAATVIPIDTSFRQSNTNLIFDSISAVTIENTNMLKSVFSVNNVSGSPHTLDIVSATFGTDSFSSSITSSELDILNDLANQINTLGNHTAVVDATNLTLTIKNVDVSNTEIFEISTFSASLTQDEIWTPVTLEAVDTGANEVPAGSISTIETPVSGLDQVDNLAPGTQGRDVETDDDFRIRRKQSISVIGAGTVPAIEARLVEDVEEVTDVVVKDNREGTTDIQGRPPKSFEAIVTFSPDTPTVRQAIAQKIWEIKPAGIKTFGNITETIQDSSGDDQTILFSAPVFKYIHIDIDITLNQEEVFPNSGEDAIKQAVVGFGNALGSGDDVIRQRFFNSVYSVSGVKDITKFDLATTENPGDTPSIILSDFVSAETESGLYTVTGPLISSGVVSGMVVKDDISGTPLTTVRNIVSETQFRVEDDVFNILDTIDFGGFGAVNIGINANERAVFDVARVNVTVA